MSKCANVVRAMPYLRWLQAKYRIMGEWQHKQNKLAMQQQQQQKDNIWGKKTMAKTNEMEKKEGQELVRIYETAAAALKMKLNPFAPLLKKTFDYFFGIYIPVYT